MKKTMILVSLLSAFSLTAQASSDEAWAQNEQAMKGACLTLSELKHTKVISDVMLFDDTVGYSALVMEGRYPQAHMNNQRGRELCLWQRSSQKAHVTSADTLLNRKK